MDAPEPGPGPVEGGSPAEGPRSDGADEVDLIEQARAQRAAGVAADATPDTDAGGAAGNAPAADAPGAPAPAGSRVGGRPAVRVIGGIVALIVVVGVIFGGSRLLFATASPSPAPSSVAPPSGAGSSASAGTSVAAGPSAAGTGSPTLDASAVASPSESLPPQTVPTATVTFNELVLYPSITAAKQAATFSFVSDGPGPIIASIVASPPTNSSRICLSGDGGTPICSSGATPTVEFYSQSIQTKWRVTVGSANEESPTVDVQLSWPSTKPSITVTQVPFQGHPNRDSLRSLTATLTARANGDLTLTASWSPAGLDVAVTVWLVDKSGQDVVDHRTVAAAQSLGTPRPITMKAGSAYRLTLSDESAASTTNPALTATLQFP